MRVDADNPTRDLMFDRRLAEDFQLSTGTWLSVATVRGSLLSAAHVLTDAVVAGHDRDEATALAWLHQAEARALSGAEDDVPLDRPVLVAHLGPLLADMAQVAGRTTRLVLCAEPPSPETGEIPASGTSTKAWCSSAAAISSSSSTAGSRCRLAHRRGCIGDAVASLVRLGSQRLGMIFVP